MLTIHSFFYVILRKNNLLVFKKSDIWWDSKTQTKGIYFIYYNRFFDYVYKHNFCCVIPSKDNNVFRTY